MRLLKLRARGQRNIARKLCSNYFHWLYLNPSSFHTSHQHLALAPGHMMYFWEKLNSDCLTPFPLHMQRTCHAPSDTPSTEFFCSSSSGLRKRSCSCQKVSTLLNKALEPWLPSTPSLCKCTSYCTSSVTTSYVFGISTESEKPLEKKLFTGKM